MIDKEKLLEWLKQVILEDGYISEEKDTFGVEWLEILIKEIKSGRFDSNSR